MILITGGTGYIGSHTALELLTAGHEVVILDNLSTSQPNVIDRIEKITGKRPEFVEGDIRDGDLLNALLTRHAFSAVIHFAGLKAVGGSVSEPLKYYENNVYGSMVLLHAMQRHGVKRIVFSSSATVYGAPDSSPIREDAPLRPANPYGHTKRMVEQILEDIVRSDAEWSIATLRYFNPIGAHESGLIGEAPNGIPNNLLPYVAQVATGKLARLSVFGGDYPTLDGTGVRDYIHVVDLARGHLQALDYLGAHPGLQVYNLGTGQGYSVLEVIRAFEQASGRSVPYQVTERRAGDVPIYYADPGKARKELGWKAERGLEEMCTDTWRWQSYHDF